MTALVIDGKEIAERGMTATQIVEALDEVQGRDACLGLRLEPTPLEKFPFQGGEEALKMRRRKATRREQRELGLASARGFRLFTASVQDELGVTVGLFPPLKD